MDSLVLGTKEYIVVRIRDRLNRIADLDPTNPTYDIRLRGSAEWESQGQSAETDGMNALCLVDTTGYDVGIYELYLNFTESPEVPRLGPFIFDVA